MLVFRFLGCQGAGQRSTVQDLMQSAERWILASSGMVDHSIAVYIPQAAFDKYRFRGASLNSMPIYLKRQLSGRSSFASLNSVDFATETKSHASTTKKWFKRSNEPKAIVNRYKEYAPIRYHFKF